MPLGQKSWQDWLGREKRIRMELSRETKAKLLSLCVPAGVTMGPLVILDRKGLNLKRTVGEILGISYGLTA